MAMTIFLFAALRDLSTIRISPSKIPASFMEEPDTRTKKVAAGFLINSRFKSKEFSIKSSAGDGKPAEILDPATGN
jgi:hypothetical protein